MDWKPLLWIAHQLLWLVPLIVFFGGGVNKRPAKDLSVDRVEFTPRKIVFGAWLLLVVYFAYYAVDILRHAKSWHFVNATNAVSISLAFIVILCLYPGTIVITNDGIQQIYWFRRNRRISWREIEEINTGKKSRTVTIAGADGTKIVHLGQLADRPRFLLELKRHCGENFPPDFPREPLPRTDTLV